ILDCGAASLCEVAHASNHDTDVPAQPRRERSWAIPAAPILFRHSRVCTSFAGSCNERLHYIRITTIIAPRAGVQLSRIGRWLNLGEGMGGVISRFHYAHRSHEDAAYSGESRARPLLRAIKLWGHARRVHGHAPVQEHRAAEGAGSDRGQYLADPDPTAELRRGQRLGCVSFVAPARLRRSRCPRARVRGT